jgi:hypothetical protein
MFNDSLTKLYLEDEYKEVICLFDNVLFIIYDIVCKLMCGLILN